MKKIIVKLIIGVLVGFAIGIIVKDILQITYYKKIDSMPIIGNMIIIKDFINVREKPTTKSKKVYEVIKGETYDILEVFEEEGSTYTWYLIIYEGKRTGWIASYTKTPWVDLKISQ